MNLRKLLLALAFLAAPTAASAACTGQFTSGQVCANTGGSNAVPSGRPLTSIFDLIYGNAAGSIIYRGPSGWTALTGNTSGTKFLQEDASGVPSWVSAAGLGTVTSVALTMPGIFSVSGSPITGAGTLAVSAASQSANTFWAGPSSGGATTPTFRAITVNDLPVAGANTVIANATGSSAPATAVSVPSCSTATSALTWTSGSGFGCNAITGTGSVTNIATGTGLTGGPITTTGTISLAQISADNVLVNASGSSAAPTGVALPSCSSSQSALLYNTSTHAFSCNTISGSGTVLTGTAGQVAYYSGSTNVVAGNPAMNISSGTLTLGVASTTLGALILEGSSSGAVTVTPQAAAGTPTLTLGTASGTIVAAASAPLAISATTGTVSVTGAAGQVLAGAGPAFTATPTLGVAGATLGTLTLAGNTSGTLTISPSATAGGWTITLPASGGSSGQFLTTNGSGVTSWADASGTGTVSSGTAGQLTYYGSNGTTVSGNTNANMTAGALTLGQAGSTAGSLILSGSSSGTVTQTAQAAAGTPTVTWGTSSGTPVVTATSPLSLTTATGNLTFSTQTANTIFAGPTSGGAATPTFRTMVASDIPAGTITNTQVNASAAIDSTKLNYTNPGGGVGVARTVSNKFTETLSITDFGAVGDCSTDDTTAVQNAVNQAVNGARIWVPPVTTCYKISSISIPAGKQLLFEGTIVTTIGPGNVVGYSSTFRTTSTTANVFQVLSSEAPVSFHGIGIGVMNAVTKTDGAAIAYICSNPQNTCGGLGWVNYYSVVENCVITGMPIAIDMNASVERIINNNITLGSTSPYGYPVGLRIRQTVNVDGGENNVQGNQFGESTTGVGTHILYLSGGGLRVTDNKFLGANKHFVLSSDSGVNFISGQLVIHGNSFDAPQSIAIQFTPANGSDIFAQSVISNNIFFGNGSQQFISIAGASSNTYKNIVITSNSFFASGTPSGTLVYLEKVNGGMITGNAFLNEGALGGTGITLTSDAVNVTTYNNNFTNFGLTLATATPNDISLCGNVSGNCTSMVQLADRAGNLLGMRIYAGSGEVAYYKSDGIKNTTIACNGSPVLSDSSGVFGCVSDARLKDLLGPFSYGLKEIMGISPTFYKWKEGLRFHTPEGQKECCFTAQNVGAVIPEAMNENILGEKQLNTNAILAALVNAVKELKAENDDIRKALAR